MAGLQQSYNQWEDALAQLELTEAGSVNPMRVAQPAEPDTTPVRPNVLLNTAGGLLAGLLLGVLLALLYEGLDTRVRTAEELGLLLKWPVLATIWRTRSSTPRDLINPTGRNANVEAYRILRTNIGFASIDKPLQTLMVTSAFPFEGKSVVASNLAIFMAKSGKSTLLIDADLHRPALYGRFGLPAERMGLSNAVLAFSRPDATKGMPQLTPASSGQRSSEDLALAPFVHAVGIPNLMVMPSGPLPPNPSELLDSKAMQRFLEVLTKCNIEVVIFDTPPLLGLSDANILAPKVEGTVVVVDINRANRKTLKQVQAVLTQAKAYVLGCVVNKQRHKSNDISYSYYYQTDEQYGPRSEPSNPKGEQYSPKGEQYGPRSEQSNPKGEQYGPRSEQNNPKGEQYGPRSEQNSPKDEQYGPRSESKQNGNASPDPAPVSTGSTTSPGVD